MMRFVIKKWNHGNSRNIYPYNDEIEWEVGGLAGAVDLAAERHVALRVSRRTLQQYFEEVLHVSPNQYLRAFRLHKVRDALQRGGGLLSVSEAAATWGFWHLSQFSLCYRRLFGELPSQTLANSKGKFESQA
jgi:AraC-like DNA-binding protein